MIVRRWAIGAMLGLWSTSLVAADLLPLKNGIYVPVGTPCKGAPNSAIVNYWGGKSSIGASQGECTIKTLSKKANVYTLVDECKDIQSGDVIEGGLDARGLIARAGGRHRERAHHRHDRQRHAAATIARVRKIRDHIAAGIGHIGQPSLRVDRHAGGGPRPQGAGETKRKDEKEGAAKHGGFATA